MDLKNISWSSYDDYINFATNTEVFKTIQSRLKLNVRYTKCFIACYSFRNYTSEVIQPPYYPQDAEIVKLSTEVIQFAENIWNNTNLDNLVEFQQMINSYYDKFMNWKSLDKTRVCLPFITKFNQLRKLKTLAEENKWFFTKELKYLADMSMLQLIGMIHQLGGEPACQYVDQQLLNEIEPEFRNEMIQCSIITFWDSFREHLPNYEYLVPLLRDFAHRYELCIPNRVDLHENLAQAINLDTILESIEKHSITTEQIKAYLNYIIEKTKELGSMDDRDKLNNTFYPILNVNVYEDNTLLLRDYFTNLYAYYDDLINKLTYLRASFSNTKTDE